MASFFSTEQSMFFSTLIGARPFWMHVAAVLTAGALTSAASAQYCAAGDGSCNTTFGEERILQVTFGTINNTSGAGSGNCYRDYTALSTTVAHGVSYQLTVSVANSQVGDIGAVWVDWNQNTTFDASEKITLTPVSPLTSNAVTLNWTAMITPPNSSFLGATRMRIRVQYNDVTQSPCGNANYGGTQDFTLNVVASGACCDNTGCTITLANACSNTFAGVDTTCTAAACNGSCCNTTNGACTVTVGGSACSGTFGGIGTSCTVNPCVGACCNAGTGACTSSPTAGCATGTTYQAQGTTCSPNPCPQPPTGACCNSTSGACTQVIQANCNGSTSTYSGDNTTCPGSGFCSGNGTCCSSLGTCTVSYTSSCPSGLSFNSATNCTPGICPATGPSICQSFDSDAVGALPAGWSSSVSGAGAAWVISTAQANSPTNSVFTNDIATVSSQFLQLPPVTVGSGGALTIDFLSYFDTEATYDGFVVETSTDGGSTWTDVVINGTWVLNGYNQAAISTAFMSPIAGRPAFSGLFTSWTEHIATVPFPAGTSVIFHFWMASDNSVAHTGVWLDNICIGGIQGSGPSGVCCRGATCNTTVTAANCTGNTLAGAVHTASGSTCNAAGSTTTPCCYPDYNKVGGITVQDIFDFLNDWFAGSPFAHFGGDGTPTQLNVQNIFDFLNSWFAGGC
jgi:hypothetical protein